MSGLTVRELAELLDPPVTVDQVQHLVGYIGLEPCGRRRSGRRGRPRALYDAKTVMEAHSLLVPVMMRVASSTPSSDRNPGRGRAGRSEDYAGFDQ